jgi:lipid-A-disaccharide synthase
MIPPARRPPHIMILAGEYSGSLYGSLVARRLLDQSPGLRLTGIGGHHMEEAGVSLLFDSSGWGGIGPMEALKRAPLLAWVYFQLKRIIREDPPDLLILIDYPGFNMLVARVARALGIPTLYYFPPGKYRSAPEDVSDAARTITRVAATLQMSFEKYRALDAAVDFVGHPLLDLVPSDVDVARTRSELSIPAGQDVVGVLPGSRLAEFEHHTATLCDAAAQLARERPGLRFVIPLVSHRDPAVHERVERLIAREIARTGAPVEIVREQALKVMAISRLLLVCSGTATLEAAFYGTPMVIVYRVSKLTEFLAPLFHRTPFKFVGLPNILADRTIVPELVQDRFSVPDIVREARAILDDAALEARMRSELRALVPLLGSKGASDRVARIALSMIG